MTDVPSIAPGKYLAGSLTENYSWRYVFYINMPIGVLAFLGMFCLSPGGMQVRSWIGSASAP